MIRKCNEGNCHGGGGGFGSWLSPYRYVAILEYQLSSASSHTNGGGSEVTFAASLTNSLVKSEWTFVTSPFLYEFSNLTNSYFSFDHEEFSSYWRMLSLQSGSSHSKHDVYVLRQTTVKISQQLHGMDSKRFNQYHEFPPFQYEFSHHQHKVSSE